MTQKYQVKVSMKQTAIIKTGIVLKQGDFGMQIEIEVLDFIVANTTPQIVFRKPMGAVESTDITVLNNIYTYTFKGTELDTPGKVICDLKLKNSTTQRISTASFIFEVVADTMNGLTEESSSYSDTIAQIVGDFDDNIEYLNLQVDNLNNTRIPYPTSPNSKYGTNGQSLRTLGNGQTEWVDQGLPTDEQTATAVTSWLNNHPEATTTVEDHSLTPLKLNIQANQPVNVLTLGVKNDGSEDCSAIINQYTELYDLYFPDGQYLISNPVILKKSITGSEKERGYAVTHGAWLIDGINAQTAGTFLLTTQKTNGETSIGISNINIKLNGLTGGIQLMYGAYLYYRIFAVNIIDVATDGILCTSASQSGQSRGLYATDISILGAYGYPDSCGIKNTHFYDCRYSNLEIMKCKIGIYQGMGILTCTDTHIYCGPRELEDNGTWWNGTIGVYGGLTVRCIFTNLYIDTARKQFECRGSDFINVTGYLYWEDNTVSAHETNNGVVCSTPNTSDGTRRMLTITNGYIYVKKHLDYLYGLNRVKYINVAFRFEHIEDIATNSNYIPFGNNKTINFSDDYEYIEIAKLYATNSGSIKYVVSNDLGDSVDVFIRSASDGSTGLQVSAIQKRPIRQKIELYLFREDNTLRTLKLYAKKGNNNVISIENKETTGKVFNFDYLNTYNNNGTQMLVLRENFNSSDVEVNEDLPATVGAMQTGVLYKLRGEQNLYKSFDELGLQRGQNYEVSAIMDKMPYGSTAQLNIEDGDVTGITTGELYIWKASSNNVIHKSIIVLNSTTQGQSNLGNTNLRLGQIHFNDKTTTWKNFSFTS